MANRAAFKDSKRAVTIVDSGASGIYLTPESPKKKVNRSAPAIQVGIASGQPQTLSDLCKLDLTGLPKKYQPPGMSCLDFNITYLGLVNFMMQTARSYSQK